MPDFPSLIKSSRSEGFRAVFGVGFFGYKTYFSSSLPDRVYLGLDEARRPASIITDEPALDVESLPTPIELLQRPELPGGTGWPTVTRQTIARLEALWLLTEDRQRLLDTQPIDPLPHQAALVEHILSTPGFERVLIADEVGLGKTIEVGLIIQRLQRASPSTRVLYLTEARLVPNVIEELDRIGLAPRPRSWTADKPEARLVPGDSDQMVVASIHKAVVNPDSFAAAGPWDVLIIDEAHHLTDYSPDSGDPRERMRLVRRLIRERLVPGGRLLLLSGTPHQGHPDRFKNLLRLLSPRDDERDAAGKVIYRIKDDIVGWDGEPLFPLRDVKQHTSVSVGPEYNEWMADVHELLAPGPEASRASAWRRAQALQWCASSPEAGLAYLTRLAIRSSWTRERKSVAEALSVLRPYRGGQKDEPLEVLEKRLLLGSKEIEEDSDIVFGGGESLLGRVLERGAQLVRDDAFGEKLKSLLGLMAQAPDEKFVVFAQPIETVWTLRRRLEQELGAGSVSFIVGAQLPEERRAQIKSFVDNPKVRVMVSSRSGGEGINLQVARHLVHFDVPWNPMEMEQRVGRVHRYGGAKTVIVDTLVLENSRETRVLDRARARLGAIVKDLDRNRFELLFGRTMALVPLEELAVLMAGEQFAPLDPGEEERLDHLVTAGLRLYNESEREFRTRAAELGTVHAGEARHADLEDWSVRTGVLKPVQGYWRRTLTEADGERNSHRQPAKMFSDSAGKLNFVSPEAGVAVEDDAGRMVSAQRVGLNTPAIVDAVRKAIRENDLGLGAASLIIGREQWESWQRDNQLAPVAKKGVLLVYLVRRVDTSSRPPEKAVDLHAWIGAAGEETRQLGSAAFASLLRIIREPRPKQRPTDVAELESLKATAAQFGDQLRETQPGEPVAAVFPIAAIQFEIE